MEVQFEIEGGDYHDDFGGSLAVLGDINGDEVPDFMVGSPRYATHEYDLGAVYVYSGADQSLLWEKKGEVPFAQFGYRVASAGDVNADGTPDFMVSTPLTDLNGTTNQGSVWVYSGADFSLLYRKDGIGEKRRFGSKICSVGDANADGYEDFAVAAFNYVNYSDKKGVVDVYSGKDGSLLYSKSDPGQNDSLFGTGLSSADDINGDGFDDLIVGAPFWGTGTGSWPGAVMVFSGANGELLMEFEGTQDRSWFGSSVSSIGDLDHDGYNDFLVGAPAYSQGPYSNHYRRGAAYAISSATGETIHEMIGVLQYTWFGSQVEGGADYNGDGIQDLLVSAPGDQTQQINLCFLSGATGKLMYGVHAPDSIFARFGDWNQDGQEDVLIALRETAPSKVQAVGIRPHLETPTKEISALDGGLLMFRIQFPMECAGYRYKILASGSGVGPYLGTVDIPLSFDSFTAMATNGHYPGTGHFRLHGQLDDNAYQTAGMSFPHGVPSSFVGRTFWFACVALDPSDQNSAYSSVALPVLITP